MLRDAFNIKAAWGLTKLFAAAVAGITVLSLSLNTILPPGASAPTLADTLAKKGLDPALASLPAHKDIRIYNPYSPMTYLHLPVKHTDDAMQRLGPRADWNMDGKPDGRQLSPVLKTIAYPILYTYNFYDSYMRARNAAGHRSFLSPETYVPDNMSETCYVMGMGSDVTQQSMTSDLTHIPYSYMKDFTDNNQASYAFIMMHEATHCGQMDFPMSANADLGLETGADLGALAILQQQGIMTPDDVKLVMALRSVSPFSRQGLFDAEHATALALDMAAKGQADDISLNEIAQANAELYKMVQDRMKNSTGGTFEYSLGVYDAMNDILEKEDLSDKPLVRRAAEMYVEGYAYLAPKTPGVAPKSAPAPRPAVT